MNREIGNFIKGENRIKRRPSNGFVSLDIIYSEDNNFNRGQNLYNLFGSKSFEDDLIESQTIFEKLNTFSKCQKKLYI